MYSTSLLHQAAWSASHYEDSYLVYLPTFKLLETGVHRGVASGNDIPSRRRHVMRSTARSENPARHHSDLVDL